jgi:sec-independent protein translocase protein TatA
MLGNLRGPELLILLFIILLLFGAKKLPDMARSLGRSARILKAETKGLADDDAAAAGTAATTAAPSAGATSPAPSALDAVQPVAPSTEPVTAEVVAEEPHRPTA